MAYGIPPGAHMARGIADQFKKDLRAELVKIADEVIDRIASELSAQVEAVFENDKRLFKDTIALTYTVKRVDA